MVGNDGFGNIVAAGGRKVSVAQEGYDIAATNFSEANQRYCATGQTDDGKVLVRAAMRELEAAETALAFALKSVNRVGKP